jgi:hypothetical protein
MAACHAGFASYHYLHKSELSLAVFPINRTINLGL